MKKVIALVLSLLFVFSLTACDNEGDGSTQLFNYKDFSVYMDAPEYKGYVLDSEKEDFIDALTSTMQNDLTNNNLSEEVEVASGTVEMGDTAHIVYVGKIDGEAFSGGSTGDEGTDLVIGSGSYIDGFEDGLVGAKIGSTVVLNLTFPEDYGNADLAGKPVEFTVTVQTVTRVNYPEITDEIAKELGFDSLQEYNASAFKATAREYITLQLVKEVKVKENPETELNFFVESDVEYYKNYYAAWGMTIENVTGMSEDDFRAQLKKNYENAMGEFLFVYYVAKEENLTVSDEEIDDKVKEFAEAQGVTVEEFLESNETEYIELSLLYENVMDFLYENAEIK